MESSISIWHPRSAMHEQQDITADWRKGPCYHISDFLCCSFKAAMTTSKVWYGSAARCDLCWAHDQAPGRCRTTSGCICKCMHRHTPLQMCIMIQALCKSFKTFSLVDFTRTSSFDSLLSHSWLAAGCPPQSKHCANLKQAQPAPNLVLGAGNLL